MKTLILMYHNVVKPGNDLHLYDVSLDTFRQQMTALKSQGHKATMSQAESSNLRTTPYTLHPTPYPVILTFDDGYKSWVNNVLDILNENSLKAYFFICLEFIKNGSISEKDIIKLKNNGMIIGSHGMKHRFLHKLPLSELFYELGSSKKILEDIIQDKVEYFSVPRGVYNNKILKVAQGLGYKKVYTSEVGLNTGSDFMLKRIPIRRDTSLANFKSIINGVGINKLFFQQKIKDSAKKIMGIRFYNWARKKAIVKAE